MEHAVINAALKGEKTDLSDEIRIYLDFWTKKAANTDF
jgi:hypothetical protein